VTKPLDDITVIEIDNWMAAPSAGAILADLGAKVIKIEPLTGDPMRDMGRPAKIEGDIKDYDFQFDVDNRGKQSILLDLTKDEALEIVKKLCATSEIFMCNLLAKRQEKFGLDPVSLSKVNPRIVHATLTGYGTQGPDAWRPGYDVTAFFGRSGIYDAMREGDDGIVPMARTAQGDHTTGLAMTGAILAALRQAERTGEYQAVETSLFETAVWTQATDYSITAVDRAPLRKRAREAQLSATANRYPCGDGSWIVFNMPEPFWWPRFADALGKPEWKEDERFMEGRDRYRNMTTLVPMIDEVLMTRSRDEWGVIMDEHGIIWGPVLGLHEVVSDPQAEAINLFPKMELEGVGSYRTVRIPMNFHTFDALPSVPAPTPGQHTQEVLSDLGYTASEITALAERGILR
jgi:crotonobetainyl-CoA:carnitine CoA-transferase CaiB-like acyl-CoA transferase